MKRLKTYLVFLSRNKAYTLINLFGFAVSMAFVILIGLYASQEYSVNHRHKDADRIFAQGIVMCQDGRTDSVVGSHWRVQNMIRKAFPEVEASCAVTYLDLNTTLPGGDKVKTSVLIADANFFQMFGFPLMEGTPDRVLADKAGVVVSRSFARKVFSTEQCVGKRLELADTFFVVKGVMEDMEGSIFSPADVVCRFENMDRWNPSMTDETMSNGTQASIYYRVRPGFDLRKREKAADALLKKVFWMYLMPGSASETRFLPLNELYFSRMPDSNNKTILRGDLRMVNILFGVGMVILLFAVFNYINLSLALSGRRAKEMATHRLFGCLRKTLMKRLMFESFCFLLVAFSIGIVLAFALAPMAGTLLNTHILMSRLFLPGHLFLAIALLVGMAALAGSLPAAMMSGSKPIDIVRGTFRQYTKMRLSKVFIMLQAAATFVLLVCAFTMGLQTYHLVTAPLGYNIDNVVSVSCVASDSITNMKFMERARQIPGVKVVSASQGVPFGRSNNLTVNLQGRTVSYQMFTADTCFFHVFGLKLKGGPRPIRTGAMYVNQTTLDQVGKPDAEKQLAITRYEKYPVSGIVEDIVYRTVLDRKPPMLFFIGKEGSFLPWQYNFLIEGNPQEVYRRIAALYKEVFHVDVPDERPFASQVVRQYFEKEERVATIVATFASVAILISLLGLVAMSTYFIQLRRREIAVRKVFGSTEQHIWWNLVLSFMRYIVVAIVVATPFAWWLMSRWLADYTYRIDLSPLIFLAAAAVVLPVSLVAVALQSHAAANENPVKNLKQE